ncbi:MAG TPA: ABC transporter permease [Pirellulales bacterium]|nr:ABC transporter permease [Pirellulales bacterium]
MRQATIVGKNLWLRPLRTLLSISGLAIAVAAVVALVGVSRRFEQSFLELYNRRGGDLVVQRSGGAMQLSSGIDEHLGDKIRSLPDVTQVIGSLMDMVAFEQNDLFAVLVNGWAPDCPVLDAVTVTSGRRLRAGDQRAVMLGSVLAKNLNKQVGQTIEMYGVPFEVVGIFDSFSVYESGAVFILLDELQRLTNRPGHVTGYVVEVDKNSSSADSVAEVRTEIEKLDPKLSVLPAGEFVHNIAQFKVVRAMAWVTSLVAIVIGAVNVANTMTMSVLERRSEIGMLRAIGWRRRRIVRLIVGESLLLCLLGASLGGLLGWLTIRGLAHVPATAGMIDGRLSMAVIWEGFLLALVAGFLGAAYPAWWASRLTPMDALRAKT